MSCVLNCTFNVIYDTVVYAKSQIIHSCDVYLGNFTMNEILWFLARSNTCYLWIIPVIYVFWPQFRDKKKRIKGSLLINQGVGTCDKYMDSFDDDCYGFTDNDYDRNDVVGEIKAKSDS